MFNDPLGNKAAGGGYTMADMGWTSYRTGSGSGNAWSDGIQYGDWNPYGGSETYREGLAMGFQDIGGFLFMANSEGNLVKMERSGDQFGYYKMLRREVTYEYYGENNADGINGWRPTPNIRPESVWIPLHNIKRGHR